MPPEVDHLLLHLFRIFFERPFTIMPFPKDCIEESFIIHFIARVTDVLYVISSLQGFFSMTIVTMGKS